MAKLTPTNYPALVDWAHEDWEYPYNCKALEPTITAFVANLRGFQCLALTPAVTTAHALQIDHYAKGGKPERKHLDEGAKAVEAYAQTVEAVRSGIFHLFATVAVGAWTAFEALATDLWVESVNSRPKLAVNAFKAKRRRSKTPKDPAKAKVAGISADMLAKYNFDLKNRVGYFLWRERHFDFNTLPDIRHGYSAVFETEGKKWFKEDVYDDLETLEAVRHCLVHRGGIVDSSFVYRVRKHKSLSKLTENDRLFFDGKTATQSAQLAIVCGLKLIDNVDNWLEDNPADRSK